MAYQYKRKAQFLLIGVMNIATSGEAPAAPKTYKHEKFQ